MSQASSAEGVEIRSCHALEQFEACVALEKQIWRCEDIEVVPAAMFAVFAKTGGQVLGAFHGGRIIGFTLANPGFRKEGSGTRIFLHSHMTAVLPEFENQGVGRRLKLFQREEALSRGIALVEWTFDPLELRNAYLNLTRLGAVMRRYLPNFYGITSSPLHSGIPTDRLVAEWWLESARARAAVAGQPPPAAGKVMVRVSAPADIGNIRTRDPETAIRVQSEMREQFSNWFAKGYVATGIETVAGVTSYLLEPWRGL
jgi:predicted GNAT superfamily acetyltransferase